MSSRNPFGGDLRIDTNNHRGNNHRGNANLSPLLLAPAYNVNNDRQYLAAVNQVKLNNQDESSIDSMGDAVFTAHRPKTSHTKRVNKQERPNSK